VIPQPPPSLEAVGVTKRHWDDFLALDAVSLSVLPGQIYCLLGAAGAGKTLLLHTFLGLVTPTAGRALVGGLEVTRHRDETRRQLTYVAQGASMYGSLTARQNVEFFTRVDGAVVTGERADYYNAMRRVGIAERYFERRARELGPAVLLSLWVAIGLLKNTPVLLFDEPTVGLDLDASAGMQETFRELRDAGRTLLVATSDVLLAGAIADRVGVLKEGRKRIELSRPELVGRSLPELYLEYMGRPLTVRNAAPRT
jgi:ABC-2 type transport system ATP-binding protein